MRKLATVSLSFAAAALMAYYILPARLAPVCAAVCAAGAPAVLLLRAGGARTRARLIALSLSAGFLWSWAFGQIFYQPAVRLAGQEGRFTATVLDYPVPTDYGSKLSVSLTRDAGPGIRTQLYISGQGPGTQPGDVIEFDARLRLADSIYGEETDVFTAKGVFLTAGVKAGSVAVTGEKGPLPYIPARMAHAVSVKLGELFPPGLSGFMKALLVGDTDELRADEGLTNALELTGTSHIVSVSGMHVAFLIGFIGVFVRKKRVLAAVGIPAALAFMALVGFSPQVVRAGVMHIFLLSAPLLRRESDGLTALSLSLLLLLAINPYSCASIGLQLSYASTIGILLFTGRINEALCTAAKRWRHYEKKPVRAALRFMIASFATTLGALIFTVPLSAVHFGTVSLAAPFANLLSLWAVSAAFCGGMLAVLLGFVFMPLGMSAAAAVSIPASWVIWGTGLLSRLPFASVYTYSPLLVCWLALAYAVLAVCVVRRVRPRGWILPVSAVTVTLCAALVAAPMSAGLRGVSVTALDVGQGQCLILESPSGVAVVDCGSASGQDAGEAAARYLRATGRDQADALILTHFDADHTSGVQALLDRVEVALLAVPDPQADGGAFISQELAGLCARRGVEIVYVTRDMRLRFGEAQITMLAPSGGGDANENGLALLFSAGEFDALITGDMDERGERALIRQKGLPQVELLIVGHHGSRYSTGEALLDSARPSAAIISVGTNTYGHPSPETVGRLLAHGVRIYRTDELGTVTVRAG